MEHGLKEGIYSITSVLDGSALTATTEGCPRAVKAIKFEGLDTQKWKVKSKQVGGQKIQIIRNETVKNNEVSKRGKGECAEGEKEEMVPVDWTFTPVEGKEATFTLHNGKGLLTNAGTDARVSFSDATDNKDSQSWTFEFLSEIVKEA